MSDKERMAQADAEKYLKRAEAAEGRVKEMEKGADLLRATLLTALTRAEKACASLVDLVRKARAELDRLRGGETVRRICNAVRVLNPAPMGHEAPHGPRVPGCNCREIRAALASGEESRHD